MIDKFEQHSPGPWEWNYCLITDANEEIVCDLKGFDLSDQHNANSLLIASAPKLLESAKANYIEAEEALSKLGKQFPDVASAYRILKAIKERSKSDICEATGIDRRVNMEEAIMSEVAIDADNYRKGC